MPEEKRILLACPTLGIGVMPDPETWLITLVRIIDGIRKAGYSRACYFPYRRGWWESNNNIWQMAFQHDFDYILRIDDDIWGARPEYIQSLLDAQVDVIGASYPIRQFPYSMCAFNREDKNKSLVDSWLQRKENPSAMSEVTGSGVRPCDLVGFGMTLIKVAPFRALNRYPMYQSPDNCPDDTYFAQLCLDNGIQQYVNLDLKLCHREVTPINRVYLFNAEARAMLNAGLINPGNTFHDSLINTFGEDGKKDFGQLKGLSISRIISPTE